LNTQGIETLKAVARRSLWLIAALVVLGVVLMNVLRHSQGPQYQASARVILSPADLSQQFSGSSAYIDPDLLDQTEKALAGSPQLFSDAARQSRATAGELRSSTSASKDGTTITFTSVADNPDDAINYANTVASAYPTFRAAIASAAIQRAIEQVQSQLGTSGASRPDLETQLNRLKVLKTLTSGNVLLVVPARGADKTRPSPVKDSLIGGLIGFFVAMVIVALREAIDTRVRSAEDVEEVLEVPVVGTVEALPRKTGLIMGNKQGERFGDMYALLAANLAQEREGAATVIAVTSATAEEGKTTTASNLAAALARRNKRVLLVDLDTRKPTVAKVFQIPPDTPGLEQILRGPVNPSSLIWTVALNGTHGEALPTELTRGAAAADANGNREASLRILPLGGPLRGGISGHVGRLEAMIASAGKNYDYVVIDTPPALALPNVTEMADFIDLVIVVVRHGRVTRRSLSALNRLQQRWPHVKTNAVLVGVPRQETYSYYEQ